MGSPSNALNISQPGLVYFDGSYSFDGRLPISSDNTITITVNPTTIDFKASATGDVQTLTPDSGGAVSPVGGTIDVFGQQANTIPIVDTLNSAGILRIENRAWQTPYIVDPSLTVGLRGTFTTIQSAITAASAGQTIFIRPGTYTENLTLKSGVNLTAFTGDSFVNGSNSPNVIILGKATATFAGSCSISNVTLKTNGDFCLSVTGTNATEIELINCFVFANNNNAIQYTTSSSSSKIECISCKGDIGALGNAYFTHSSAGAIKIYNGVWGNNAASVTASTVSGSGSINIYNAYFANSITTSSTSSFVANGSQLVNALIINGTGSNSIYECNVQGATSSAISVGTGATLILADSNIDSTNTNAITGAGTIQFGAVVFSNSSSLINTTTQTPLVRTNDAIRVTTPGAYPYTATPQDGVILVDTSVARTINLNASPATGQTYVIKDNVGSAAANNITITPAAGNIDAAGTYAININYGSVTIVYTGAKWAVI